MVNQSSLNELALFAGAGGGILGGKLLGWRTVCAVEWEPYPASVLCARQNDGLLPPFPIWDDVQTFDGHPWRGIVDVISGGFPCQDISAAGKGAGIDGERSGMWRHMARLVGEVRPKFVFVENSPMLVARGLERVLGDLSEIGYDTKWIVMGAANVGAPHQRDRIWILGSDTRFKRCDIRSGDREERHFLHNIDRTATKNQSERERWVGGSSQIGSDVADTINQGLWSCSRGDGRELDNQNRGRSDNQGGSRADVESAQIGESPHMEKEILNAKHTGLEGYRNYTRKQEISQLGDSSWWSSEPNVGRVAHGVAARVDRLKAIGNGQVPLCAAEAWRLLSEH